MSTLKDRLEQIAGEEPEFNNLANLCKISPQAVKKWFGLGGLTNDMKMSHLFKVADYYRVDPRWLGTGEGDPKPKKGGVATEPVSADDRDLLRAFNRLHKETRFYIRGLIQTINASLNPQYQEWSRKEGIRAALRDSTSKEKT